MTKCRVKRYPHHIEVGDALYKTPSSLEMFSVISTSVECSTYCEGWCPYDEEVCYSSHLKGIITYTDGSEDVFDEPITTSTIMFYVDI